MLDACLLVFSIMRYFQSESVVAGLQLGETMGKQPFTNRKMDYWGHVKVPMALGVGVVGTGLVSVLGLSVVLQREFRWVIYRHISGSLEMLRRYVAYQVRSAHPFFH